MFVSKASLAAEGSRWGKSYRDDKKLHIFRKVAHFSQNKPFPLTFFFWFEGTVNWLVLGWSVWPLPPLTLQQQPVAYKDSYVYLGVLHDDRLNFDQHHDRLSKKLARSAGAISHLADPKLHLTPRIIRRLVQSVLYGQLGYSFPLIPLSSRHANKYLSIICRPLRRTLGVPRSCNRLSLMVEMRLPAPVHFHRLCCARFAYRFATINNQFNAHGLHSLPYHRGVVPLPCLPPPAIISSRLARAAFHNMLRPDLAVPLEAAQHSPPAEQVWSWSPTLARAFAAMSSFGVAPADYLEFIPSTRLAVQCTYNTWLECIPRPQLAHFYPDGIFTIELPRYLHDKTRDTRSLRARIRFNRCRVKATSFLGLDDSPNCSRCRVLETVSHVLLRCSRTSSARHLLITHCAFLQHHPLSLSFLVDPLPSCREAVDAYLRYCLKRLHL